MIRQAMVFGVLLIVGLSAICADAQTQIFWQGGPGEITDSNYTNGTTMNLAPGATNRLFLGDTSDITYTGSGAGFGRLRVGHNQATEPGPATLTVSNGTTLQFNSGAGGVGNAGIQVGAGENGVLNIDGATVYSSRLVVVGAGDDVTKTGTLNITNGGVLDINEGNLNLADGTDSQPNGLQGILNISGADSAINIIGPGADLALGWKAATATYIQSDGTVSVRDSIEVGQEQGSSTGTSFSVSGGTITIGEVNTPDTGPGNFWVGRGSSINATTNISGAAEVNVGNRYLMGGGVPMGTSPTVLATGAVTNHSGGTLNVDLDLRIADTFVSPTSEATYNLSGAGIINTNVSGTTPDVEGTSTIIGRRGIGRFIQTGGTANLNSPLIVGDRQATTAIAANGLYEISAGNLNVNAPTPTWPLALSIAPNGTGEFRVVGDDSLIDVTGDFAISSTANGNGTLAFELEAGDLLSQIDIAGTATFNAGAILLLDASAVAPGQSSYDLLTAGSIVDSGIAFNGPAGWGYEIVTGGNGQILRIAEGLAPVLTGDHNLDGVVDAADYVAWAKTNANGPTGYTDWVEQFGQSAGSGGQNSASSQVPEPAAAGLIVFGLLSLAGRRCRWAI